MLAQAQECVWQWAVMGAVTIQISVRLFLAPTSRSQFKRDDSETCCGRESLCLHVVRFNHLLGIIPVRHRTIGNSGCRSSYLGRDTAREWVPWYPLVPPSNSVLLGVGCPH